MGLFDEQINEVRAFIDGERASGALRELDTAGAGDWSRRSSLVLEEDTALELGNPKIASLCVFSGQRSPISLTAVCCSPGPTLPSPRS